MKSGEFLETVIGKMYKNYLLSSKLGGKLFACSYAAT